MAEPFPPPPHRASPGTSSASGRRASSATASQAEPFRHRANLLRCEANFFAVSAAPRRRAEPKTPSRVRTHCDLQAALAGQGKPSLAFCCIDFEFGGLTSIPYLYGPDSNQTQFFVLKYMLISYLYVLIGFIFMWFMCPMICVDFSYICFVCVYVYRVYVSSSSDCFSCWMVRK